MQPVPPAALTIDELAATTRGVSKRQLRKRMFLLLIASDVVSLFLGFLIAAIAYGIVAKGQWWIMGGALLPVYLGAAARARTYSGDVVLNRNRGIARAVGAFINSVGLVLLGAFLLKVSDDFSRVTFAVGALLIIALLIGTRYVFHRAVATVLKGDPYSTALIADGSTPTPEGDYSSVLAAQGWLDPTRDCPRMYDRLALALHDVDRVVIACAPEHRLRWVNALKGANVRCEVIAPELAELAPLAISSSSLVPTLAVVDGPLSVFDAFLKRSFDVAVSLVALLLLLPMLIAVGIAVRLESPGPVLFVQERIGRRNRVFRMLKFRSMRHEAHDSDASRLVTRGDDRVTRVGRFIRATSIDEFPQLLNVLKGDMSIVGPRPHALGAKAAAKLYWEVDGRYWHRHAVKPGLTGLAQVRGFRGNTEHEGDLLNRLQADLEYLHGWSIWRDVLIVLRTVHVLGSRTNAY